MEINIEDYLTQFSNKEVFYIPNPGNAGDSIIAEGTMQKCNQLGINLRFVDRHRHPLHDQIVFYGGGGNIAKSNFSVRFIRRIHNNVKKLVILPHTIHSVDALLNELGENVDIICREKVSYLYLMNSKTKANVYLAKDMALHMDTNIAMQYKAGWMDKISVVGCYVLCKLRLSDKQAPTLKGLIGLFRAPIENQEDRKILNAFRTDGEKTKLDLPDDNLDISEVFALGTETEVMIKEGGARFLKYINQFEVINTNRLHVAISATLVGKSVNFYPNNYYKCQAVYEYSLKQFSNLTWHDQEAKSA